MTSEPTQSGNQGYIQTRGPSAAHVQQAIQRFLTVNEGRLQRVREGLQSRQQQCFDLLPLLFHLNQSNLPGYINHDQTPIGISQYQPSEHTMRLAQTLARGTLPSAQGLIRPQLSAMYLMGSSGSIGQSTSSDLDIWLCYEPELQENQVALLEQKASLISRWADDFNLEVHFFLMNAHRFQGGEQQSLTGENCGSTQRTLLLDEFYRTAQLLAGNVPAWWLVPAEFESDYQQQLDSIFQGGYFSAAQCTDFGGIEKLPPGEFIGAGMWQLYKGIDSPYKSVLKLILLEVYASEYPSIHSISHQYKQDIYRMHLSLDDLDPYVMLYRRIESYLTERGEFERLELIRRCFYFKVGLSLSKTTRAVSWRRELMEYLVNSWGWQRQTIKHLDNFRHWTIDDVMNERRLLINELTNSYRFLTEFASEHHGSHVMSQRDLLILSRKLHTAFDRRPGKIDFIRIGLDVDLSTEKIRLHERESKQERGVYLWAAYNQPLDSEPPPSPLKYSKGLLETLLWSHLNGLLSAHLHIPVYPLQQTVNDYEIRMIIASMRQHLPTPMKKIESSSYYHPAILTKVVLFINVGQDPLHYLSAKGLQKISARSNSLDFSALRENLVMSLDMVLVNTWGEVVVERYDQDEALSRTLKSLINRINKQSRSGLPLIETVCHSQTRPQAIAKRVKEVFVQALETLCTTAKPKTTRFVFNMGDQFIGFQQVNRVTRYQSMSRAEELAQYLAQEQETYSPVVFDQQFAADNPLWQQLYEGHTPTQVSLAYETLSNRLEFSLIDEQGSLISFSQPKQNVVSQLAPLVRFLKMIEHRQRRNTDMQLTPQRQLQVFRIERNQGQMTLNKIQLSGLINKGRFISIQVTIDQAHSGGYEYHFSCNAKEFNSSVLGDSIYKAVASFVLGLRASGQRYPTYITDLTFSEGVIENLPFGRDQTRHYVQMKLKLEARINSAMTKL